MGRTLSIERSQARPCRIESLLHTEGMTQFLQEVREDRRWLPSSPAAHYEYLVLELLGAWEPSDSSGASQSGEAKETPPSVPY
jgi:hypothetical protein